ncbi:MAG: hypothetical protein K1X78_11480 [Verrucomicrobiaceae bacterium]|nr:hypothetical protein [Verrucomicrobiaceae bacterium]
MSTPLENPVDEIRRIKTELAAEDGYELARMTESLRKLEAELRRQGRLFADFSKAAPDRAQSSSLQKD